MTSSGVTLISLIDFLPEISYKSWFDNFVEGKSIRREFCDDSQTLVASSADGTQAVMVFYDVEADKVNEGTTK